ncbi:uncharacterized protein LOC110716604 [Chenopodium quinoa]|uniref:Uncharacterized protein n=1 Tax=Chenopodium quinoa TaxID=63459 RepID=A0A803MKI8_CHEQI|nr:uncharacterized protein LOC110716604 [Chenopodium quinoa]
MSRTTKLVALMNITRLREARKPGHQHHYMSRFAAVQAAEYDQGFEREHTNIERFEEYYLKEETVVGGIMSSNKSDNEKEVMKVNKDWVPHPRTGIYFPEGQDWVLNDVPENSASLGHSQYWLRNIHGAEKHDPDMLSADHYFLTQPHE